MFGHQRTLTNFMCTLEVGDPDEKPREEEEKGGGHWVVGAALAAVLMGPG